MAKTVKKTATKKAVAKKAAKKAATGCDIETALKLMQRKQGATRADLNEADFRRPAIAAINSAKARGLKTKVIKKDGARAIYIVSAE
jgi:hypothetical protein